MTVPAFRQAPLLFLSVCALCAAALPLSCLAGQYPIGFSDLVDVFAQIFGLAPLSGQRAETIHTIVVDIRLARGAAAACCGGALAVAGAVLQGALRNPLADPFTLGLSAGAACGASIMIAAGAALPGLDMGASVNCAALLGCLAALFLTLLLGRAKGGLGRENVILAGIAVAAFLGAIVALVKALNEESVASIVFWLFGSLQGASWRAMPLLLLSLLPGLLAAAWGWRRLDVLALGDDQAQWLGLDPGKSRFWLLLGASCMTAGCVAVAGIIGFVGLAAPHILRLMAGPGHGALIAAAFPTGALLLLAADCASRAVLDGGQELPVGIITALCGAPFFAWLIWRRR